MSFYILKQRAHAPETTADTTFIDVDPVNTGDAPMCPTCGVYLDGLDRLPPYRVELEQGGEVWGDIAFGTGKDVLISERLKMLLEEHGIEGFEGFDPVEVVRVKRWGSGKKAKGSPPRYFRVTVKHSRAALDRERSGVISRRRIACPECNSAGSIERIKKVVLRAEPQPVEDVFVARGFSGVVVATRRFKHFCEQFRITNAVFIPAEKYARDDCPRKDVWTMPEPTASTSSAQGGEIRQTYVLRRNLELGETCAQTRYTLADPQKYGKYTVCLACGTELTEPEWLAPHRVELNVLNKDFGDVVYGPLQDLLISERLRVLIQNWSIAGLERFDPVEVVRVRRFGQARGMKVKPPLYYRVRVKHSCAKVNPAVSGVEFVGDAPCSECGFALVVRFKRIVLEADPAPTEDIFVPKILRYTLLVSERFKHLCDEHGVSNISLVPAGEYGAEFYPE